jgi:hypothetical protein
MSSKKEVNISKLYTEISKVMHTNMLRGKDECEKKLSDINIGNNNKLGKKTAKAIMKRYDKYIDF